MPKHSAAHDRSETNPESSDEQRGDDRSLEAFVPSLAKSIRVTGFWGAIVLPVFYLPLLVTGLSTALEVALFLGLVAVNLTALYVGHTHRRG